MTDKTLLKTYIKQAQTYKQMLERVNLQGRHSAKIDKIEQRLENAKRELRGLGMR